MFAELTMAPADPILGLTEAYRQDPNPAKINLGVGIYVDDTGVSPLFAAVRKAEQKILAARKTKAYLPIPGSPEYGQAVQGLIFGAGNEIVTAKRARTALTPGGTGGLRVAGDFLHKHFPQAAIWFSEPTWSNHFNVFRAAGIEIKEYPYYDAQTYQIRMDALLEGIAAIPEGDVVLLHGCCHNPSGVDPSPEQWDRIARIVAERKLIALVDLAYQGFGQDLEQDAEGVRRLCRIVPEVLIASSYSKNIGLYNDRVGALTVVAPSAETADIAFSHVKAAIRANYSNPPAHGGAIVSTIMSDDALRAEWEEELAVVRGRIQEMRRLFAETMKRKGVDRDFSFLTRQHGMFALSGLNREQVDALKKNHSIYLVGSGRVNVAGMTSENMDRLCDAVAEVLA